MKNNISRSIVSEGDKSFSQLKSVMEMKDCYERFHHSSDGKIKVDMSIHAEYTSNREIVTKLSEYTKSIGANMHIHLSETKREVDECKKRHKMSPVEYFDSCGVFETNTTAAHCVWVSDGDIEILRNKKVNVATNPTSNLKLASGIAPVNELVNQGINVVLGTDSVASNNSLNMLNEMKLVSLLSKYGYNSPVGLENKEVLRFATVNGAIAQGRENCGLIKEGYRADLILVDLDSVNMTPVHDSLSNLIYSSNINNIKMTMVDGEVLYRMESSFQWI